MVWDLSFQIVALLIIAVILVFLLSDRRLPVNQGRVYLVMIAVSVVCAVMNMYGGLADSGIIALASPAKVWTMNVLFYAGYILRLFVWTGYFLSAAGLLTRHKIHTMFTATLTSMEAWTVWAVFHDVFFTFDASGVHINPGYVILDYLCFVFAAIQAVVLLRYIWKRIGPIGRTAYLFFIAFELTIPVLDFVKPEAMTSDIMSSMILLVILLARENPIMYRSREGSAFNRKGLGMILRYGEFDDWQVAGILIQNYRHMQTIYRPQAVSQAIDSIARELEKDRKAYVFLDSGGLLILMSRHDNDRILKDLMKRAEEPWIVGGNEFWFSFGAVKVEIANMPRETGAFLTIVRDEVKAAGKNEILELDNEEITRLNRRKRVQAVLDESIRDNAVCMFLQPIIHTQTGKIEGAEALARLYDSAEMKYILPYEFIPAAEKTGLILPLGKQMIQKACDFFNEHPDTCLSFINVNVSPEQFADPNFIRDTSEMVKKSGVPFEKIHLEITEEAYINDSFLSKNINALHDSSFLFALDDFGTGYSSLSRVIENQFSNIKLDMSFVRTSLEGNMNIMPELIQAFHKLGKSVTAEGVEAKEMADRLKEYSCDFQQGYLYSRPVPTEEFLQKYPDRVM